jgi:hypothetical protein
MLASSFRAVAFAETHHWNSFLSEAERGLNDDGLRDPRMMAEIATDAEEARKKSGWRGIRTPGRVTPTPVFKTGALDQTQPSIHAFNRFLATVLTSDVLPNGYSTNTSRPRNPELPH